MWGFTQFGLLPHTGLRTNVRPNMEFIRPLRSFFLPNIGLNIRLNMELPPYMGSYLSRDSGFFPIQGFCST